MVGICQKSLFTLLLHFNEAPQQKYEHILLTHQKAPDFKFSHRNHSSSKRKTSIKPSLICEHLIHNCCNGVDNGTVSLSIEMRNEETFNYVAFRLCCLHWCPVECEESSHWLTTLQGGPSSAFHNKALWISPIFKNSSKTVKQR